MVTDLTDELRTAIEAESKATEVEKITSRKCASDAYDGIQYNIFGRFIDIRPIINLLAEKDNLAIEQLHHTNDDVTCLGVFIVEAPEEPHPAFVN